MFSKIFFLVYIFAGFAGGLAILMAVLLIKYWSSGNKQLLAAIRNFMICTALIDALYFYFDYDMLINGDYGTNAVCRVLDICFFIGQVYFWTSYVRIKSMKSAESLKTLERVTRAGILICAVLAVIAYSFMMSDYYQAAEGARRTAAIIIEAVLMAMLTFINLWNVKYSLSEIIQKKCRRYIIGITGMLVLNGVWNGVLVISMLNGRFSYMMQVVMDPTPVFLLAINTLTILLILSEDFTALFKADRNGGVDSGAVDDGSGGGDAGISISGISASAGGSASAGDSSSAADTRETGALQKRLDYIAETHFLTEREREVMELAYHRMTNPEIAEKLCISKYTVKNHMHNIFEKLDISARADLIMFVDKGGQPGKGRE